MFTDMVGYTALGQKKEELSLALIDEHRRVVRPILRRHDGREVKTIGDSFLVEFPSALDAVRCAYDIQRAVREFNLALQEGSRVHLRVGIHLGDVVDSEGDISGDAVNLASRIEQLAEDGGVCLTRQIYDQVHNKFELPLDSMGPKELKNIRERVDVYRMVMPWGTEAATPRQFDTKRIAVLPLANISPDPKDEYFSDGMTDEVISTISKVSGLRVIARTSVMGYKGGQKRISDVARELEVGSVLEGSVRKAGNRVRVSVQLIDPRTSEHLWAESYDRELKDVFGIQSDIARTVAEALKVQLLSREKTDIERKPTISSEAYTLYLKGRHFWNERTRDATDRAVRYFEEAIKRDPSFALSYAGMADCHVIYGDFGWMGTKEAFGKAREYATKALDIDPRIAEAHTSLAAVRAELEWRWQEAEVQYKAAIELKPSYATVHQWFSIYLVVMGRLEEALDQAKIALELDPFSRAIGSNLGVKLLSMGRPREAVEQFKRVIEANPDYVEPHDWLGFSYYVDSKADMAIDELRKAVEISGFDPLAKADLACVLGLAGQRAEALEILSDLGNSGRELPRLLTQTALVLFAVGKTDEAFDRLELAYKGQAISMGFLTLCQLPMFRRLRAESRWVNLRKRLGVPQ